MNKSNMTHVTALAIILIGYFSPIYADIIFMAGLFALSGSITNNLAIHMLFEKVPLLYGSGVIPNQFENFKLGIRQLIIEEFFNQQRIDQFFTDHNPVSVNELIKQIDFDKIFTGLTDAILASPMGGMLNMFGGKAALEPIKEPVTSKLEEILAEMANEKIKDNNIADTLINKVEAIIDNRLQELTPQQVKAIIQRMIHQHLGWLVIWGGVFGGLVGLVISILIPIL